MALSGVNRLVINKTKSQKGFRNANKIAKGILKTNKTKTC